MSAPSKLPLNDRQDDDLAQYRALSVPAVAGLILGLLSVVALVDPLAWLVPLTGVVVSAVALRKIARAAPALTGRRAALAGLVLSVLFGTAAVADWTAYRALTRHEARQFALLWFELLAEREPKKAFQLTLSPRERHPADEGLTEFYREGPHWHRMLLDYVDRPLVRTLLALGPRAVVRYYETRWQQSEGDREKLYQVFAVTFDDGGQKKTFFVGLTLHRIKLESGPAVWQIADSDTGFKPEGL
jgi:hypothetical protein